MKHFYLILILALTFLSCKQDTEVEEGDYAFIGGEIINPKDNFVVLKKAIQTLDTIKLDGNNRFLYKIKDLEPGLYTFHHGGELQMVLLEPSDSLMFRLNTFDFDESLVYTGKGAKKNNYLIDLFLRSETEEKKMLRYSQLNPEKFEKRIDSFRKLKNKKLHAFNLKYSTSPIFREIAQANINYNYYLSKELYPFTFYGSNEYKNLNSLPDNFYSYRKDIDYNSSLLQDYFPYYTFLRYHFNNLALSEHFKQSNDSIFNRASLNYNLVKLNLIDSLVSNKPMKNSLLSRTAVSFFSSTNNLDDYDTLLVSFLDKSDNEDHNKYVSGLANSLKKLKPGSKLPSLKILDYSSKEFVLNETINKPTVLFFWSYDYLDHFKESHKKVTKLREKYPEINFMALNVNKHDLEPCEKILKEYNFSTENEFVFKNAKKAKSTLAIMPINKVILVDKHNNIINPNANMFTIKFEEQLLGLINR